MTSKIMTKKYKLFLFFIAFLFLVFALPGQLFAEQQLQQDGPIPLFADAVFEETGAGISSLVLVESPMFLELASRSESFGRVRLNDKALSPGGIRSGDSIQVDVFSGATYLVEVHDTQPGLDIKALRGTISGSDFGYFHLTEANGETMVVLSVPEDNRLYVTTYSHHRGDYYLFMIPLDRMAYPKNDNSPLLPSDYRGDGLGDLPVNNLESALIVRSAVNNSVTGSERQAVQNNPNTPATIDVMIVYTPAARNWAGTQGGIDNIIGQSMLIAATTLDNSNVGITMNLVHSAEVNYNEVTGRNDVDLYRLTWPSGNFEGYELGPYLNEVHPLRDQYGADLVALYRMGQQGGVGWLFADVGNCGCVGGDWFDPYHGFTVSDVPWVAWTGLAIHEKGHNMGAHHHKMQNHQPGPNTSLNTYSAGWRWSSDGKWYNSVMSYQEGQYFPNGPGAGIDSQEVAVFSNPNVTHYGVSTGHPADADNARTLRESKHIIASFRPSAGPPQPQTYQITLSANPAAGGQVNGAGTYNAGHNLTVSAVANQGYSFVNWTENGAVVSTSANYNFTVNSNRNLVANFQQSGQQTYQITLSANPAAGGQVNGAGTYNAGHNLTVSAVANQGYSFVNWTENGAVVSTSANYNFTVNSNRNLVANFQQSGQQTYQITLSANPAAGGQVNGAGTYNAGHNLTVSAVANQGYSFVNWTENGAVVSTSANYNFTVNSNRNLVANFQQSGQQTYQITLSANPAAGGQVNGAGTYNAGHNLTVSAIANQGYSFVNWTENGAAVSTSANYNFTVNSNRNLVANFQATAPPPPPSSGDAVIFWQDHSTGRLEAWVMDGRTRVSAHYLFDLNPNWHIAAVADLTGNGSADLIAENRQTGLRSIAIMNGFVMERQADIATVNPNFRIVDAYDMNGNGRTDIILQNINSGRRDVWFMNGTAKTGEKNMAFAGINWHIAAVHDMTGDGRVNLVWENRSGARNYWVLNNNQQKVDGGNFNTTGFNWRIVAAGDICGDGRPDLIFQNVNTGLRSLWRMNGFNILDTGSFAQRNPSWTIVGVSRQ